MWWEIKPSVYRWIKNNIPENSTILELGSGNGTTRTLHKNYNLYSVEHNPEWLCKYPSNYIHADFANGWYVLDKARLPEDYALLIVDGPEGKDRANFVNHFDLFKRVPIVVDDTEREGEQIIIKFLLANGYTVCGKDSTHPYKQWMALKPNNG